MNTMTTRENLPNLPAENERFVTVTAGHIRMRGIVLSEFEYRMLRAIAKRIKHAAATPLRPLSELIEQCSREEVES
jgi:hypothetical protein